MKLPGALFLRMWVPGDVVIALQDEARAMIRNAGAQAQGTVSW